MSTEQCGTIFLSSLNKESKCPKAQRWVWHMELSFLVTLSLSWHLVCVYSLSNRYEVMKQRREVLNNDRNTEVLFARSLWRVEEGWKTQLYLSLSAIRLWPRLAPFNSPPSPRIAPELLEGSEGCEKHVT